MVKRLCARGVEATLVAPVLRGARHEADPAWVTRLPAPLRVGNAAVLSGLKPLMKRADVVHLHYPFFGTAEGIAQDCLWMKKPLVTTFHMDATADGIMSPLFDTHALGALPPLRVLRHIMVSGLDGLYRLTVQPAILRASRRIFVSSFDYADHSSLRGFRQAHPERVIELPFGVDHARFASGTSTKAAFGMPDAARVVGFVGGMDAAHAFKGLPVLLDALALLPDTVHALLVGDGPQRRLFEVQARDRGVASRCHFVGRLSEDRLPEAYRAMDVFAFPSTNAAEAFGLAAVEAMSSGVPVIASDLPGVRTVVSDGTTGLLVPANNAAALADALRRLLDNEALRQGMAHAARERARMRYDWNRYVDGLMEVYRTVVGAQY